MRKKSRLSRTSPVPFNPSEPQELDIQSGTSLICTSHHLTRPLQAHPVEFDADSTLLPGTTSNSSDVNADTTMSEVNGVLKEQVQQDGLRPATSGRVTSASMMRSGTMHL